MNISFNDVGREKKRRFVVWAVFFIYILSLLEGPLRKWILPNLAEPLIVLRDPFVIALYIYCLFNRLMMRYGIAGIWLNFAVFTSFLGFIQYTNNDFLPTQYLDTSKILIGWLLGIRAYWLYMPLAFVVAKTFRPEDVIRFLKFNLWLALPYAMLIANQYGAGSQAFINRGVGGAELAAVGLTANIVRPFGLFTYTGLNVQFTSAMLAIFLAISLAKQTEQPNKIILLPMGIAVGTMSVLTGSRSIFFSVGIIFAFTLFALLKNRLDSKTMKQIIFLFLFLALAGWILVKFFPDMLKAMQIRIEDATQAEGSIWNRAYLSVFTLDSFAKAPIFGHGIGAGASGVAHFLGLQGLVYGESDTQRNINELGIIFGSIFVLMRWFTSFWLLRTSIRLARKGLTIVLPLATFAVFSLAVGQITFSPLISFLPWLCMGLVLAYWNSLMNPTSSLIYLSLPNRQT